MPRVLDPVLQAQLAGIKWRAETLGARLAVVILVRHEGDCVGGFVDVARGLDLQSTIRLLEDAVREIRARLEGPEAGGGAGPEH